MIQNIEVICHSSIRIIERGRVIYIDPYELDKESYDADYIFVTHSHYDHFSTKDIEKIKNENTIIVITEDIYINVLKLGFSENRIVIVEPNNKYKVKDIEFETVPAYNIDKKFHPKDNGWVGYIFNFEYERVYVAGDTDMTPEIKSVECDIALIPIGGTYTMDYGEASILINKLNPRVAIPTHYGKIVGTFNDAEKFKHLINRNINCELLIKDKEG